MIAILDYGIGNPSSILNMIKKAGGSAVITADPVIIRASKAIILPGVGSFDNGMTKLNDSGLTSLLNELVVQKGVFFLGICLGMQLLFESSEEGSLPGLGFIKGKSCKFNFDGSANLKVPHMGWNIIQLNENHQIYKGLEQENRFYFVHSYFVKCTNKDNILATANYGGEFTCSVAHKNIIGAQFHPEKSHKFGMKFFKNFLEFIC